MIKIECNAVTTTIKVNNDAQVQFWRINDEIAGLPIYKDRSQKLTKTLHDEEARIKAILKKHPTDVILACHDKWFKYLLENTQEQEIGPEMFVTTERKIAHYITVGVEPAVLLISVAY